MRAKVSDWRGLCLRTSAKWADFVAQSLHWKLPFPTQVRDWFDDWVVGSQFDIYCLHHPVLPKPQIPAPPLNRPFLWGFSLVSFRSFRLWRHFAVSQPDFSLASLHPKIPFPASGFSTARSRSAAGNFWGMEAKNDVSNPVHNYCGFNPRASNCWLHSAGTSRSRSTPIPRGKRPSTAARTRSGARNASEIVMLT